jgi:hypothetical protein
MLVRGTGIGDISGVLKKSIPKGLQVLKSATYQIKPKQNPYDCQTSFGGKWGKRRTTYGVYTTGRAGKLGETGPEKLRKRGWG